MIAKSLLTVPLLALGCVVAGIYGMLHDQLSYTLSPEYFHSFKFHQFRIPVEFHGRAGAAVVGLLATWWMGVLIGVPLLAVGLFVFPTRRAFVTHTLVAILVVVGTAAVVGLVGLAAYSLFVPDDVAAAPITRFPGPVTDPAAFRRVGALHDASYLGGAVGLLVALGYVAVAVLRVKKEPLAGRDAGSRAASNGAPTG